MNHIFPPKLEEFLKEGNIYIPRRIYNDEHLKLHKRYWIDNIFYKIDEIYLVNNVEYYIARYERTLLATFSYPINNDYTYELLVDRVEIATTNILKTPNVSYTGAEIKTWFLLNNIEFENEFKFCWPFLDPTSQCLISDSKSYFIYLDRSNNYRLKLDQSKENSTNRKRRRR